MNSKDSDDTSSDGEFNASEITWRDYIAIFLALSRTVILPFIIVAAALLGLFLISIYVL